MATESVEHIDTLLPPEMAIQAEHIGVSKANMPFLKTFVLSILAGAFIAFGALFSTTITAGSTMSFGVTKLLGGLSFSLGLILVIIGGAELFTGNNLIIMAWANKKITTLQVLRNWLIVYIGNFLGAIFVAVLMLFSKQYTFGGNAVGLNLMNIAKSKCELGFVQAIALGILCNILVCLAVWLCFSAKSASVKILCIIFPITAFVAAGFEHSIANMYFITIALLLKYFSDTNFQTTISNTTNYDKITIINFFYANLLPVSIGNLIGGAGLVGLVYWFVYLKSRKP